MMEALLWQDECARHGVDASAEHTTFFLADKDEKPLHRHLNAIVPVSFACVGDRIAVSAYPKIRSDISTHFEKYCSPDAVFSEEAFAALDVLLRPHLDAWGYRPSAFRSRYGISLMAADAAALTTGCILDGTVRMTAAVSETKNLTSMRVSDCIAHGAFAHVVGGEIVCISSVNYVSGAERCVEIGVECAPDHRRRGYAASCVCALTRSLCAEGKTVLYRHYHTNIASAAVARTVGFVPVGRFFSYTSFAI